MNDISIDEQKSMADLSAATRTLLDVGLDREWASEHAFRISKHFSDPCDEAADYLGLLGVYPPKPPIIMQCVDRLHRKFSSTTQPAAILLLRPDYRAAVTENWLRHIIPDEELCDSLLLLILNIPPLRRHFRDSLNSISDFVGSPRARSLLEAVAVVTSDAGEMIDMRGRQDICASCRKASPRTGNIILIFPCGARETRALLFWLCSACEQLKRKGRDYEVRTAATYYFIEDGEERLTRH